MFKAAIFDIDGTLSLPGKRLEYISSKPKNWKKFFDEVYNDEVIPAVVDAAKYYWANGYRIIISTGRSESCRDDTNAWLQDKAGLTDFLLYMRAKNDFRPDYVIKKEFLDDMLSKGFKPLIAFDDKKEVVDMYQSFDITCALLIS